MKQSSKLSIVSLEKSVATLMTAYAANEYDKLVHTEMERRDNFAIIVEDYYMGKALGESTYISGKTRDLNGKIIDYNPNSIEQNEKIEACYYSDKYDITSSTGNKLGTIRIFISDHSMNSALNKIITDTLFNALAISLLLIVALFIAIRLFVLKPLSNIVSVITNSDSDGIPIKKIPKYRSKEISFLANSMNSMITSIQNSRIKLQDQNKNLQLSSRVFMDTHEGIIITDANKVMIDVNPAFCRITGYSRDDAIGKNPSMLSSGDQPPNFYIKMWEEIAKKGHWQGEIWNRKKNGEVYAELLTISSLKNDNNEISNYVGMFSDITHNKQQQEKLSLMAHYDELTELPNRVLFASHFQKAIAHSNRTAHQLAVCFLDLDNFKPVNDNYGHETGDQILIEVAKRIRLCIREEDTVSRQGGDEFALLLNDIGSFAQVKQTVDRIHHTLAKPYLIDGTLHKITASTGITLYPTDEGDIDTLLRHADNAMYQAKLAGKHRYHLFNTERDNEVVRKHHRLEELDQALNNNEFELYYQPKVNMITGDVFGAEALIRWIHPENGLIPPLDFLPIIEGTDLEKKVGNWVINEALLQLKMWHKNNINLEVSVNISSHHLQSETFYSELDAALAKQPSVSSNYLQLEILESSALGDINAISGIIDTCQSTLGVKAALDDFGTGYSSLTHLRNIPVNTIKVDQSFVRDMLDDPNDYAIIDGIIGLANSFNRNVIAEGVETTAHGLMLMMMHCKEAQGYGIAKPMPANEFPQWLKDYTPNQEWLDCGKQHHSSRENKVKLFCLISTHWKDKFITNLKSHPEAIEFWPIMDKERCPCGAWIKRAKQEMLFEQEDLNQLDQAHNDFHLIAHNLLLQYQGSEIESALEGITVLQSSFKDMGNILGCCE